MADVTFDPSQPSTAVADMAPQFDPGKPSTPAPVEFDPAKPSTPVTTDHWYDQPLASVSADTVEKLLPDIVNELGGREGNRGFAEELTATVNGLLTPKGLGLIGASIIAPAPMALAFGAMGAKQLGKAAGTLWGNRDSVDAKEAGRLSARVLLSAAQTVMAPLAGPKLARTSAALFDTVKSAFDTPNAIEPPIQATTPEAIPAGVNAETRLGILPPGTAEMAALARESATKLDHLRQGFRNLVATDPVRQDIARAFDAADNQAKIEGEQVGNSVRLDLPDPMDRKAATFIIEANGDRARLGEFEEKALAGEHTGALEAIRHARDNWDRLEPAATRISDLQQTQLEYEQSNGLDPGNVEGYVKHAYDMDVMLGRGRPVTLNAPAGAKGLGTAFTKQRSFATYADAIEAGYKPKTLDIADLVQSRVTAGERLVNRNKWAESLSGIVDPVEGTLIVTSMTTQPKGTQVAPMGYVRGEVLPGVPIAVHEGYAPFIDSLLAPSRVKNSIVGRVAMGTEGFVKHGMLMVDTFHAGRMIYKELALTQRMGHDLGRSLLEYADEDLNRAVVAREITPEAADFARARRPDAELLTANGLNVGRISDALNREVLTTLEKIPGIDKAVTGFIKPFNSWVFDKLTRGAMLHSGLMELDRLRKAMPEATDAQLAGTVSKNMNIYYGNLGKQGWIRDATFQDLARVAFLAPQWVEGMVKTEIGSAVQAGEALADLVTPGKSVVLGPLAKGVGTGVIAMTAITQIVNMAFRGHPTWQNEEHGHQMDAWIPDITGKGRGFWLSPLGIHAEMTHDALRYYSENPQVLATAARIMNNKASPLVHAFEILGTGTDWNETHLEGDWNRAKGSLAALNPSPIPLQALFKDGPPGSLQRQITASLGIKTEAVQSDNAQVYSALRRFNTAHGSKNETSEPSDYRGLNNALRNGDPKATEKAFNELVATKSEATVLRHYHDLPKQLFTGSRLHEADFQASLTGAEAKLYEQAREERIALAQKFFEHYAKRTAKP